MTEEAYPYTATNGTTGSCKYNASANAERYLVGYTKIVPNPITGEQILQQALAQTGPLSICKFNKKLCILLTMALKKTDKNTFLEALL